MSSLEEIVGRLCDARDAHRAHVVKIAELEATVADLLAGVIAIEAASDELLGLYTAEIHRLDHAS